MKFPFFARLNLLRFIICAVLIISGAAIMFIMGEMKEAPAQVNQEEQALHVKTIKAEPENISLIIKGYGEVKSLNTVRISPEVSGRVDYVHPRLEPGELISKGETLFSIDSLDFQADFNEITANIRQLEHEISILKTRKTHEKRRLKTFERNRTLAEKEYRRHKRLCEKDMAVSRSRLEASEQVYNSSKDRADEIKQVLDLYPLQILKIKSKLDAAKAKLEIAGANLRRCKVIASFDGWVKSVSVEKGQLSTRP